MKTQNQQTFLTVFVETLKQYRYASEINQLHGNLLKNEQQLQHS